jgi:arylformamidase
MEPMKIFDISVPIRPGMATWPGDPSVKLERLASIEDGADANISQLQMCVHSGTHIDAPNHFLSNGKTVEGLPLETFIGEALVLEIAPDIDTITRGVLVSHEDIDHLKKAIRVLFKTRNSDLWSSQPSDFQSDYVGLDASAASFLAEINLSLVGLDYLSVATFKDTYQPHQILLSQGMTLLEGIDLSKITPGKYDLFLAPLLIEGCEGAPARAFLIQ